MKRLPAFACLLLLCATSCKKLKEAILKDPCSDIRFCNVSYFYYPGYSPGETPNLAKFTYDAYGNPLTVKNSYVSTGYPDLVFRYDGFHRLQEFFRPYANGHFETWSKYFYDASGRIAFDTTYVFGSNVPHWPPADYVQARRTTYKYDNTCRIIQTSTKGIGGPEDGFPAIVNSYSYDAAGNRVGSAVLYDHKVNIHRTNKVFMFVDRDYSMNNPFSAATYNGYLLPAHIGTGTSPSTYFLQRPIYNAVFSYACD